MKKVQSTEELNSIKQLGNTIYLRKNIKQKEIEDDEGNIDTIYEADEVSFEKNKPDIEKIQNNFELYWNWANEKEEKQKIIEEKKSLVKQLIDKEYNLADLKEAVDQLVKDNLS